MKAEFEMVIDGRWRWIEAESAENGEWEIYASDQDGGEVYLHPHEEAEAKMMAEEQKR